MEKSELREEYKDDIEAILVANAVMLFIFGFDTQGTTISVLFHNLIKNPDCQDRIAEEITEALNGTDGQVTYEMLESLKYTDMALKETMRYTAILFLISGKVQLYSESNLNPASGIEGEIRHLFATRGFQSLLSCTHRR